MKQDFLDYIRALSKSDKKTLSQKALKTAEEVGELAKVVLPHDNAYATNHRMPERERILEESCDILLCALSVAYSMDFTDEEIDEMLRRKSDKWSMLQAKERDVKYPLPYEIHITVEVESDEADIELFRTACKRAEVKPIVIDLQNNGKTVMRDVMTSSHHFGTNSSALTEMTRIERAMYQSGFNVVRSKIETVPWHPAAPKFSHEKMPANCYFEAHIGVRLLEAHIPDLRNICKHLELHVSRNAFKKYDNGYVVIMATYRDYATTYDLFNTEVNGLRATLHREGFDLEKPITEFAVYDTKVSHDASWLKKG